MAKCEGEEDEAGHAGRYTVGGATPTSGGRGVVDGQRTPALGTAGPAPGSLLLKMQPEPTDAHRFSYLPIAPTPGELWAFPSYVQHAVLPRHIGTATPLSPRPMANLGLPVCQRISLAMNIYKPLSLGHVSAP